MNINIGDVIQTSAMKLRVIGKRGGTLQCEYWDNFEKTWKPRGVSENAKKVAERVESGVYRICAD